MHLTLKQFRLIKGKKQCEMAELLGVHVDTYRKLEEKPENVTVKQAKMISNYLGVSYNEIFFAD